MNKSLELYKHNEEAYKKIDNAYQNDVNDYVFSVSGIFRISPKPVVQP